MKITCVIPARLASRRFPEKILHVFDGAPLIEHTWRAAQKVTCFDHVVIALDNPKTAAVAQRMGADYIMTDPSIINGTHRLIAAMPHLTGDIWVNWQADEPHINDAIIHDLLRGQLTDTAAHIWTLKTAITHAEHITDPHTVKVITDVHDRALYFSRAAIPHASHHASVQYYKHIGLYAYTTAALEQIASLPACTLAEHEQLEQLQFLFHGIAIVNKRCTHGIDTINDLAYLQKKE